MCPAAVYRLIICPCRFIARLIDMLQSCYSNPVTHLLDLYEVENWKIGKHAALIFRSSVSKRLVNFFGSFGHELMKVH